MAMSLIELRRVDTRHGGAALPTIRGKSRETTLNRGLT
jgi:hypothetical protein